MEQFKMKQNHRNKLILDLQKKYCQNDDFKIPYKTFNLSSKFIKKDKKETLSSYFESVFNWKLNRQNFKLRENEKKNKINFENEKSNFNEDFSRKCENLTYSSDRNKDVLLLIFVINII